MNKKEWFVYLVRYADESLYYGITNDIERRLVAHNLDKGAKYTKSRMGEAAQAKLGRRQGTIPAVSSILG